MFVSRARALLPPGWNTLKELYSRPLQISLIFASEAVAYLSEVPFRSSPLTHKDYTTAIDDGSKHSSLFSRIVGKGGKNSFITTTPGLL
jgi:hypothetical protein